MDMRVRRASLPAVLAAAFLLLLGWHVVPAWAASVDPELVAESVTEDGYYVDSSASYLKSDADLDKLRAALEQAGRAGVVVLPAGTAAGPVLTRLLQSPNHKATYVVLSGTRLQAASSSLSKSTVNKLVAKATKAGDPKSEVLTFLDLLNPKHPGKTTPATQKKAGNLPDTSATADAQPDGTTSIAPAAAKKNDSGSNGMLYGIGGVVVIAVLAAAGGILWRRKQATSTPRGNASGE